jgi:arsenate reductase
MGSGQTLRVYHYAKCGTCRGAVKLLKEWGYTLEPHDLFEKPASAEELRRLIPASGLPLSKWFNVNGEAYKEMGLKDKLPKMTDEEKIELLASNGRLVKRPVVANDAGAVTVGFKEEEFSRIWYNSRA